MSTLLGEVLSPLEPFVRIAGDSICHYTHHTATLWHLSFLLAPKLNWYILSPEMPRDGGHVYPEDWDEAEPLVSFSLVITSSLTL